MRTGGSFCHGRRIQNKTTNSINATAPAVSSQASLMRPVRVGMYVWVDLIRSRRNHRAEQPHQQTDTTPVPDAT